MRSITILRLFTFLLLVVCSISPAFAAAEKLYVVTDKQYYYPGETVQFQVFVKDHSVTSNNSVFVDLLDNKGNILAKKIAPTGLSIRFAELFLNGVLAA